MANAGGGLFDTSASALSGSYPALQHSKQCRFCNSGWEDQASLPDGVEPPSEQRRFPPPVGEHWRKNNAYRIGAYVKDHHRQ